MLQTTPALSGRGMLGICIGALLMCAVALINGGPIYYPDTGAYLIDADKFIHLRPPYAVRPIFYGLAIWPLHWRTLFLPAVFVQALIVTHAVFLTVRACGCKLELSGFLCLILALVILTPVSFHVSHLLPDVFVGVLILALFLLGFCSDALSRAETCYLLLLATAVTSFHLTAIPVGLALFALSLFTAITTRQGRVRALLVLAPVVLAIVLSFSFSVVVFQTLTLTPKNPPHLLARVLADGPGRDFLRATCPQSAFKLCDYQDRLTSVEDDFLWELLPTIPSSDGYRIKAEASAVMRGTVATYPVQVLEHMLSNTFRQLVTFRSETQVSDQEWANFQASRTPLALSLAGSMQAKRLLEKPALDLFNAIHAAVVMSGFFVSLVLVAVTWRAGLFRPAALIITVLTGLLANAFACGALGGVFPRYEGRVIWLLPLAAVVAAVTFVRLQLQNGPSRLKA